ncbi:MAG TPA: DUF882 domain-containing protein [Deltaproteobacteria bacterium]|nr:DUF882 domain-containing protein [Deltaproteobacteria bacterium]
MADKPQPSAPIDTITMGRRRFLKVSAMAVGGCFLPGTFTGALHAAVRPERSLSFYNLHTGEGLNTIYWAEGQYIPEALAQINHILRDHRSGEVASIDARLLDLLHELCGHMRTQSRLHVISGYRSPHTNAILREHRTGIARNSLHTQGKAIDIRLPGHSLASLRQAAVRLRGGGVGYYPDSDFVHMDTGRVRYW